jgi:hypothetical protein
MLDDLGQFRPRAGFAKGLQFSIGVPFLIDVDAVRVDRVGGDDEIATTRRSPRFAHGASRGREEALALSRADIDSTRNDDHYGVLPRPSAIPPPFSRTGIRGIDIEHPP